VTGMLVMILSDIRRPLFLPLLLAALILGIVAIARGRRVAGLLLFLTSLTIPVIAICALSPFGLGEPLTRQEAALSDLSMDVTSCRHEADHVFVEGIVRNNGYLTVTFVRVYGEIQAEDGRTLSRAWAYLVEDGSPEPGAEQPFEVAVPYDPRMSRCEAYFAIVR
jgi:hypothetical protein